MAECRACLFQFLPNYDPDRAHWNAGHRPADCDDRCAATWIRLGLTWPPEAV